MQLLCKLMGIEFTGMEKELFFCTDSYVAAWSLKNCEWSDKLETGFSGIPTNHNKTLTPGGGSKLFKGGACLKPWPWGWSAHSGEGIQ